MKSLLITVFFSGLVLCLNSQSEAMVVEQPNIVPNESFEQLAAPPIGWFYKGKHFTRVAKYWSAPTAASPDLFGPRVRVPTMWAQKGFGAQKAFDGESMVGITVYGCGEGKPHCREYIQVELIEPLIVGQNYEVVFQVAHLPQSMQCNNLGIYFSENKVHTETDALLSAVPQVNSEAIIEVGANHWTTIKGHFTATTPANYLLLGNFFADDVTAVTPVVNDDFQFVYYYIDAVEVRKSEPILPVPLAEDDLSKVKLEPGKVIPLRNIFFESDRSELLPRSFAELRKLVQRMQDNPNLIIQINGHTDNQGDAVYNKALSLRRAQAVVNYLVQEGIDKKRLQHFGYGKSEPIASNKSAVGRQQNRRVELIVLQK